MTEAPSESTWDLTGADIDALERFLHARTAELLEAHPHGSAEHIAAAGLEELVRFGCWELRDERDEWEDAVTQGRTGETGDLRLRAASRWAHLLQAAVGWQDHPDFDAARWQIRRFGDPELAARVLELPDVPQPRYPRKVRP